MTSGASGKSLALVLLVASGAVVAFAISPAPFGPSLASDSSEADPLAGVLDHMYNLEFTTARQVLGPWVKQHPSDLRGWNYLAESILDEEMLEEGMLATGAYVDRGEAFRRRQAPVQKKFEDEFFGPLGKAQSLGEARLRKNPQDQEALYWTGVSHGTRAEFYFVLLRKYVTAAHEGMESRRYEMQLAQANPQSCDPLLIIGLADYAAGSLPWYEKIILSVAGVHGNRARGLAEMERAARGGHWTREDAKFVLIAVYRREKMYNQLLADVDDLAHSYPRNYLLDFEKARALKDENRWREAADVYDGLVAKLAAKGSGGPTLPAPRILFLAGQTHEHLGEQEQALKLYEQAGNLPVDSEDVYRADLAAARLEERMGRASEAKLHYRRVASRAPGTDEGRAAYRALKSVN